MRAFCYFFLLFTLPLFSETTTVVVSLDGFRYDYINKADTPVLDSLIKSGVSASSLQPVFPTKTFPSHISMATGLHPESHGIIDNKFENLVTGEYYTVKDNSSKMVAKWYRGEFIWETLARYGYSTGVYLWLGSESFTPWKRPAYSISWSDTLTNKHKIEKFDFWLNKMHEARVPELFMLYFDDTDALGHKFGTDGDEIKQAIKTLDSVVGEICKIIAKSDNKDSTNLIVLSDHGMKNIYAENAIDVSKYVNDNIILQNSGAFCRLAFKDKSKIKEAYDKLNKLSNCRAYLKSEIPEYLHFSLDPNIGDILLLADEGYFFKHNEDNFAEYLKGVHGFDPQYVDMHGIFIASGDLFKKGVKTGTLHGIDIYALICKIYKLDDYKNTQSNLDRIRFIFK